VFAVFVFKVDEYLLVCFSYALPCDCYHIRITGYNRPATMGRVFCGLEGRPLGVGLFELSHNLAKRPMTAGPGPAWRR